MPFPEMKRIIYRQNPLDQVICQLRFPPILRIDAEIPADFQDRIRKNFPNLTEVTDYSPDTLQAFQRQVSIETMTQYLRSFNSHNYEFSSEDSIWKVNLTRTFLALTTGRYTRWETFKEKLRGPFEALLAIYQPTSFTRIGLRYIDVIRRSELGLDGVGWQELLQPYILGLLGAPIVGHHIQTHESSDEIALSDHESMVRVVTRFVEHRVSREQCFMIDSDFHTTKKVDITETIDKLDFFNTRASRLIQWCITDRLHTAMEPETL